MSKKLPLNRFLSSDERSAFIAGGGRILHYRTQSGKIKTIAWTRNVETNEVRLGVSIWTPGSSSDQWNRKQNLATAVRRHNVRPAIGPDIQLQEIVKDREGLSRSERKAADKIPEQNYNRLAKHLLSIFTGHRIERSRQLSAKLSAQPSVETSAEPSADSAVG
jgi:hypothetical protein